MSIPEPTTETSVSPDAVERFAHASDAELLDAWNQDHLPAAFAALIQRHSVMVLSVCRRKCRSLTDAEDAYQTTFLLLAKNGASIRRPECLAGWLHRVAQRASIATLQRAETTLEAAEPMTTPADPLDRIAEQHEAMILDEELAALPEHYRTALVMHVYEGCQLDLMAQRLQTSVGALRGHLQRGKRLLAKRLRRRGIAPLIAYAAAAATCVTASEASASCTQLLHAVGTGPPPSPPISDHLLRPLLSTGQKMMSPWNLAGGIAAVGAAGALLLTPIASTISQADQQPRLDAPPSIELQDAPIVAQFGGAADQDNQPKPPPPTPTFTPIWAQKPDNKNGTSQPDDPGLAEQLRGELNAPAELTITGNIDSLADQLQSQLNVPVILNDRALEYAELPPDAPLTYTKQTEPLRTALRKILDPLGLKATVEADAIVITANPSQLVYQGIGTDRWLNTDDEKMRSLATALEKNISQRLVDIPLSEAMSILGEELEVNFAIDRRGLEVIGLDADIAVNIDLQNISAIDLIFNMLRDLDLTLTVRNNVPTVTTREVAEDQPLTRIYWLEGLGLDGDVNSLMQIIQTTIDPGSWEALGGNGTMGPAPGNRPNLVINTNYLLHRQIEQLISTLRKNSFATADQDGRTEAAKPNGFGGIEGPMGKGGGGGFM